MNRCRTSLITASLALCLLSGGVGRALARPQIASNWRAQYPDACQLLVFASQDCTLCHYVPGYAFNPYGQDLKDNSVDFVGIESMDSDGDGRTNGEEILLDCTLPGDDTSTPAYASTWGGIKALYR